MKHKFLLVLVAYALCVPVYRVCAADTNSTTLANSAASELQIVVGHIQTNMQAGKRTEAALADNIKEMDALIAKHKGETNDDVAEISFMKATLYLEVFDQTEKGTEMLKQIQHDFPTTKAAKRVDQVLVYIQKNAGAKKIHDALAVNSTFPNFEVKDLDGKALSVAGYKGKVVMIDFWATWCGPCVGEIPNVAKVYQKYHDKGFEVIGISLDREDGKEHLISFAKEHNMPWRQYFDGKFWSNDLAVKYGVMSIPQAYLLDGSGKIIGEGEDVRGEALEPAVKKALGIN